MIKFTVPGEPVAKGRPKFSKMGGFVRTYTPQKTIDYENKIQTYWKSQSGEHIEEGKPIILVVDIYVEMPKSWSKKKRAAMDGKPHQSKPDLDNIVKCIADALNGYAYADDNAIYEIVARKFYSYEPRAEIVLTEGETDGI